MSKNLLLSVALVCSRLFKFLLWLALICIIGLFIHNRMKPDSYKSVLVNITNRSITFVAPKSSVEMPPPPSGKSAMGGDTHVLLNEIKPAAIYLVFVQIVLSIMLSILMVREVVKILKSVRDLETFNNTNIKSFRLLGYYCLMLAGINSILIISTNRDTHIVFNLDLTLLIFMLAAFIMAEIFAEGHKLSEQDQLTI
jgi:hypothetical protein